MGSIALFLNALIGPLGTLKTLRISLRLRRFSRLGRLRRGSGFRPRIHRTFKVYRVRPYTCFAVRRIAGPLFWGVAIAVTNSPAIALDINAGQAVYETHCANCHGADGTPTMLGTPDFSRGESLDVTDVDLVRGIKNGRNLMPAYDTQIKDEDILNVISYIRTLRR